MKNVMEKVFEHPIGTAFLVTAITGGVVRVIRTLKRYETKPETIIITEEIKETTK